MEATTVRDTQGWRVDLHPGEESKIGQELETMLLVAVIQVANLLKVGKAARVVVTVTPGHLLAPGGDA